ncbi:MAG: RagB/SusD family nutrient uptake outer membrane protein [Chitinophagaceae bacterium]|nr:RagB/SusD family nutrient uptake outer membrane protein [Chitinophagaceae bacterium]
MKKILLYGTSLLLIGITSCKKDYLETEPSNGVTEQEIFSKLNTVYAALDGVVKEQYAFGIGASTGHDNFGQKSFDLQNDLMGNDMVVHSQGYGWFNTDYNLTEWTRDVTGRQPDNAWYFYYDLIKQVNKLLAIVDGVADASAAQKEIVKGQSLGIRAYAYFYLINYFQQTYKGNETKPGVPLYTEAATDGKGRGTVQEVYTQIIADLTAAEPLLNGKPRTSKANIDVTVVQGLRARVALIQEDWATAATYAAKARIGYTLMTAAQYTATNAFSSLSNAEWMWGSTIPADQATIYASFFSHMDIRTGGYAALGGQKKITKALYDQINAADERKKVWRAPGTGTTANPDYNQLKHQVPTAGSWAADYLYMRASEMYLIEAEGLARSGQEGPARTALETVIKARYPAYSAAGFAGTALISEILLQRRIELWGEGFSLMDIKRLNQGLSRPTGAGNHGSPNFDPGVYTTSPADARFIMRIPKRELDNNTNMTPGDQNP